MRENRERDRREKLKRASEKNIVVFREYEPY